MAKKKASAESTVRTIRRQTRKNTALKTRLDRHRRLTQRIYIAELHELTI